MHVSRFFAYRFALRTSTRTHTRTSLIIRKLTKFTATLRVFRSCAIGTIIERRLVEGKSVEKIENYNTQRHFALPGLRVHDSRLTRDERRTVGVKARNQHRIEGEMQGVNFSYFRMKLTRHEKNKDKS